MKSFFSAFLSSRSKTLVVCSVEKYKLKFDETKCLWMYSYNDIVCFNFYFHLKTEHQKFCDCGDFSCKTRWNLGEVYELHIRAGFWRNVATLNPITSHEYYLHLVRNNVTCIIHIWDPYWLDIGFPSSPTVGFILKFFLGINLNLESCWNPTFSYQTYLSLIWKASACKGNNDYIIRYFTFQISQF